jgi:hypothetical protein
MKVRVLHPTIIDSQWLQIDDVVEVENEKAQPYVETGLIEVIDDAGITPPNAKTGGEENPPEGNPPEGNPNPPNKDNDGDENPPDEDGGKDSKSGKGK